MALIVEDGTGRSDAEAYVSVADADAYHTAMGNTAWTGDAATKEAALRRATQYIDTQYTFKSSPLATGQRLAWPREQFYIDKGVRLIEWPVREVRDACCELAVRSLAGSLYTDQADRAVTAETVGPISVQYGDSRLAGQQRYMVVNQLLKPLVTGGSNTTLRVNRA